MTEVYVFFLAGIAGVVSGFLVSVPVGPINVTILNEGPVRGVGWALMIGLGAVVMETAYCGIAFAGFSELFFSKYLRAMFELISFLLMMYLGLKYVLAQSLPLEPPSVDRIERRFHPHTAFMTGFVRVLGNPGILLFWITVSATVISHAWVAATASSKFAFVSGVAIGALGWFVLLSLAVTRGFGQLSTQVLLRMSQISGACLLFVAVVIGGRLVLLLAHRPPG